MVTRKPVAGQASAAPVPSTPIVTAPTPTSPAPSVPMLPTAAPPPIPSHSNAPAPAPAPVLDVDEESDDEWDKSDEEDWEMAERENKPTIASQDLPAPLRISRPASANSGKELEIPAVLRVGPPGGIPQVSQESLVSTDPSNNPWRSTSQTPSKEPVNNPFIKAQNTGEKLFGPPSNGSQNSSAVWASTTPPQGQPALAELPAMKSPTEELSNLSLYPVPPFPDPEDHVASPMSSQPPLIPVGLEVEKEAVTNLPNDAFSRPTMPTNSSNSILASHQAWQDQPSLGKQKERAWDAGRSEHQSSHRSSSEIAQAHTEGQPPALPPRTSTEEQAPPKPPQPEVDTSRANEAGRQAVDSPGMTMKKQRNQTYQIKKVRWYDERVLEMRVSPILIQNANGPCPLLALVNALTLSTPKDVQTVLVDTLRSREQVSLGLLLDAVFEELMSGRRGDGAQELPDVSDLYSFLIALHTGMNVNPRFTHDPDEPGQNQAGGFEKTREMRLYSTFNVPLIHGWLPETTSEAYAAFERSAKTYEDAQNIQFYEEELETKLNSTGLNTEEQHMFEDLHCIKHFLTSWPTQLTKYGLEVITKHLQPGEFAILFRNDHFSTLYKDPRSKSLVTVVTDAGYSSHEEIVWESLVDTTGMGTEHFSGDFRPVSHSAPESKSKGPTAGPRDSSLSPRPVQSMLDVDQNWTTVQGKKSRGKNASTSSNTQQTGIIGSSSASSRTAQRLEETGMSRSEQEDADLALALQLQEEEEDRQRRAENERRNRQLSAQVLDQAPASQPPTPINRPLIPPRRANNFTTNRPPAAAGEEAPPPTYEQASKDRRFNPPPDHPASPHAPVAGSPSGRQQSAYMQMTNSINPSSSSHLPPNTGRRQSRPGAPLIDQIPSGLGRGQRRNSAMLGSGQGRQQEEKCVLM